MAAHFTPDYTDVNLLVELCIQDMLVTSQPSISCHIWPKTHSSVGVHTHWFNSAPPQSSHIINVMDFLGSRDSQ